MLILLHAALGAAASMKGLQEIFTRRGVETCCLDFPGHGQTAWPEQGLSMNIFEEEVIRFMDERGLASAHVFGYSMGGFVALNLALRVPERILSLCTLATKMDWTEAICARESALLEPEKMEAKVPQFARSLAGLHSRNGWEKVVNETRKLITQMHTQCIPDVDLAKIQQPACVLLGDRDTMVSAEETLALYRVLPNAMMALLPETPHSLDRVDLSLLTGFVLRNMQRVNVQNR
ncbi:MAG: alpha/beta fold hydrolase [Bacteroidetes bacterium]|nr:alpha/beta fold hydrolase [Bacteroidota bacterium]